MAKTPASTALAAASQAGLPAEIMDQFQAVAGLGMEGIQAQDLLMPRLTILQALSPQINPRKPEYIAGAQAGQIVNTATGSVFDEIQVIPCLYQRRNIEWAPNRGGLVHDWGTDDSIVAKCRSVPKENNPKAMKLITPDGNDLVTAGTWYVLNLSEAGTQGFIAMTSSQFRASRAWMTKATAERLIHPLNGPFQPPLFYRSYKLKTAIQSKDNNEWFGWSIERDADIMTIANDNPGIIADAKALIDAVKSGAAVARAEAFGEAEAEDGNNDSAPM